jgi:hypothetical protein
MTPGERIATALAIWPGREVDVSMEVGVSKSLLRMWSGKPGGRYTPPSEADAERVETGVRALLQDCLAKLNGEEW